MNVTIRTVRRVVLAVLVLALVAPAGILMGLGEYYRSGAYARRIAGRLEETLEVRVSVGRVDRVGRRDLRVVDLRIGGTADAPVLAAPAAEMKRNADGHYDLRLLEARLSIRSRRDLEDLVRLTFATSPWRVVSGGQGQVREREKGPRWLADLAFADAVTDWHLGDIIMSGLATGACRFQSAPGMDFRFVDAGGRACLARFHPTRYLDTEIRLTDVPVEVLQSGGLLAGIPLEGATASGSVCSDLPNRFVLDRVDLQLRDVSLGPVAEHLGFPGVSGAGKVSWRLDDREQGRGFTVRGPTGGSASIAPRALRHLAFLLEAEAPDIPDTADRVRVTRFDFVCEEDVENVRLSGALEPSGTVIEGELPGDTAPRALLRLRRTSLLRAELDERLRAVRRGEVPTASRPATSRPASRHAG